MVSLDCAPSRTNTNRSPTLGPRVKAQSNRVALVKVVVCGLPSKTITEVALKPPPHTVKARDTLPAAPLFGSSFSIQGLGVGGGGGTT